MRLARNLGSSYLLYAASIVSGLVLTPIIIDAIGKEGYGVWLFIGSVTIVLRLLDFGITPTVVRFTAFHRGRGRSGGDRRARVDEPGRLRRDRRCCRRGGPRDRVLPARHDRPAGRPASSPAQVAAVIVTLTLGIQAPLGLFGTLLKGAHRFDVLNAGGVVSIGVYAAARDRRPDAAEHAADARARSPSSQRWSCSHSRCSSFVASCPGLRMSRAAISRDSLKGLLGFSWFAFLGHIAGKVVFSADVIVIGIDPRRQGGGAVRRRLAAVRLRRGRRVDRDDRCCCRCRASSRAAASTSASALSYGRRPRLGGRRRPARVPARSFSRLDPHGLARLRLRVERDAARAARGRSDLHDDELRARAVPVRPRPAGNAGDRPVRTRGREPHASRSSSCSSSGDIWTAALATLVVEASRRHPRAASSGATARHVDATVTPPGLRPSRPGSSQHYRRSCSRGP